MLLALDLKKLLESTAFVSGGVNVQQTTQCGCDVQITDAREGASFADAVSRGY